MQIKKREISILIILMLVILIIPHIHAQTDPTQNLEQTAEQIQEIGDTLTDEQARNEFLKKEWNDFLSRTTFGVYMKEMIKEINPILLLLFKIRFSFSRLFFFTVLIWFILVTIVQFIYQTIEVILSSRFRHTEFFSTFKMPGFIVFIISALIVSLTSIPLVLGSGITSMTNLLENQWIEFVAVSIALIILATVIFYINGILKWLVNFENTIALLEIDRKIRKEKSESSETKRARLEANLTS